PREGAGAALAPAPLDVGVGEPGGQAVVGEPEQREGADDPPDGGVADGNARAGTRARMGDVAATQAQPQRERREGDGGHERERAAADEMLAKRAAPGEETDRDGLPARLHPAVERRPPNIDRTTATASPSSPISGTTRPRPARTDQSAKAQHSRSSSASCRSSS